jgi:predicted amidohydrolase YtcJ
MLRLRLNIMVKDSLHYLKEKLSKYKMIGYANNFLNVRSIKCYIDGALGSRGAWMLSPYLDAPGYYGQLVTSIEELKEIALLAVDNGFQVCTHAIGTRGNREILNIYEDTFSQRPKLKDLRWRVEHAQHLSSGDISRFGQLGVIAAMQGIHCTSDAPYVYKRLGEKRAEEGAYVWRKLIDSGAIISNGTDAPVERINPLTCFYASVTRKLSNGKLFFPEQSMTRIEALKSYTINGAYASFEEEIKGSLSIGKLADIVVLSNNILNCKEEMIKTTEVIYTIIGGKVLYSRK